MLSLSSCCRCGCAKASLWANEFDLSLHPDGDFQQIEFDQISDFIKRVEKQLVVNDGDALDQFCKNFSDHVNSRNPNHKLRVAIILDNSGPELAADLCLAEYLLTSHIADHVSFHGKSIPWFVSDVTGKDFNWLLNMNILELEGANNDQYAHLVSKWSEVWRKRIQDSSFRFETSYFWTTPCTYDEIEVVDASLYQDLSRNYDLIIFKGDLNYRKLLGDRQWKPDNLDDKINAFHRVQIGRSPSLTNSYFKLILEQYQQQTILSSMSRQTFNEFLAGAIGGLAGLTVGHPMDTVKVVMQSSSRNLTFKEATDSILETGLRRFFTGLAIPFYSYGFINAVVFTAYKESLSIFDATGQSPFANAMAGAISGAVQLIPAVPVEVIKIRQQSIASHPGEKQLTARKCIHTILRMQGFSGFYSGTIIQAFRDIPGLTAYFYAYSESIKIGKHIGLSTFWSAFIGGAISGALSWCVSMPFVS
ncbi:unnamed protein product [Schistosoma bovis]|nr:unnamed protein product [Schistosoma bovis]